MTDNATRFLVASQGHRYVTDPEKHLLQIVDFDRYFFPLNTEPVVTRHDIRAVPTGLLFSNMFMRLDYAAEVIWRCSIPMMCLILVFLAVPFSRVKPRQGRYAKLIPAVFVLIVYANSLFVLRDWIERGVVSPLTGGVGLHLLFFGLACFLFARSQKV